MKSVKFNCVLIGKKKKKTFALICMVALYIRPFIVNKHVFLANGAVLTYDKEFQPHRKSSSYCLSKHCAVIVLAFRIKSRLEKMSNCDPAVLST